jgi:hypothetical protein
MNALRTSALRFVDELTLSVRSAGQAFAFLSDGRELVQLSETETGLEGRFPDHADEGWPALSFPLPRDATFHQATSSVLTRSAAFGLLAGLNEVEKIIDYAGLRGKRSGPDFRVELGPDASMRAVECRPNGQRIRLITTIMVRQSREPDAIVTALANRGRSRSRRG